MMNMAFRETKSVGKKGVLLSWLAGLLALCALMAGALPVMVQPVLAQTLSPGKALVEEAVLKLEADALAVAINADESILAVASAAAEDDAIRITLYDRPSRAKLGVINAKIGKNPALRFSPTADVLLAAGEESLELWELPISPLDPNKALTREHVRWEVALDNDESPGGLQFSHDGAQVFWVNDGSVYRRPAKTTGEFEEAPFWRPEEKSGKPVDLVLLKNGAEGALITAESKEVGLLALNRTVIRQTLKGHRFEVVSVNPSPFQPLRSLDAGNNLVRWDANFAPESSLFLSKLPKNFVPQRLNGLGKAYLLITGTQDAKGRGYVLDASTGKRLGRVSTSGSEQLAPSPTGRYLVSGESKTLKLYGFGYALSPLDYVRRLRALQADKTAQSYVRLMDTDTLTRQMKADLLAELSREAPVNRLNELMARLEMAVGAGDAEKIKQLAERVLAIQPDHPQARKALNTLREQLEVKVLAQAKKTLEMGQYRQVIKQLSTRIAEDSPRYPEALALIRKAEAKRGIATVLEQAREKLNMGDYAAAQALVNEALRKDETHEAALALADEIDSRDGLSNPELLAAGVGSALALGFTAFAIARYRKNGGRDQTKGFKENTHAKSRQQAGDASFEESGGKAGAHASARATAGTAGATGNTARGASSWRGADENSSGRQNKLSALRKVVADLGAKTEDMIRRTRALDAKREYTALLMEMEAELNALLRRLDDPTTELGKLHQRLKDMQSKLKALKFQRPQADREENTGKPVKKEAQLTYYDLLKVTPSASVDEIKTSYHKLLKQYHPDLHNRSEFDWVKQEADRMSKKISEAYDVLGNKDSRAKYDVELKNKGTKGS